MLFHMAFFSGLGLIPFLAAVMMGSNTDVEWVVTSGSLILFCESVSAAGLLVRRTSHLVF